MFLQGIKRCQWHKKVNEVQNKYLRNRTRMTLKTLYNYK